MTSEDGPSPSGCRSAPAGAPSPSPASRSISRPLAYNDADQLTTTQTSVGGQSYDSTSGVLNGLSNTSTGAPTLAALSYNARALASAITYKDSSGATLATQNLQYDSDLRPTSASTGWQSGGTIYSDAVSYDAVGNVTSRTTTQAAVSGVQNYCYDEQNRLVWASNSVAAQPPAGESCGTTALQGTLGGSYTASYVYTHLGQLWQGPLNGRGTQEQYLYCNSSHPHQVTALSALSANPSCSSPGTTDYSASYDN
jgi:hypothetical protein